MNIHVNSAVACTRIFAILPSASLSFSLDISVPPGTEHPVIATDICELPRDLYSVYSSCPGHVDVWHV